jgi:farnesol dehydrogenase
VKVLLTGGTGFLGRNVARHVQAAGHALRLLARESSDLHGLEGIETARGDVTDADSLRRAAEGCGAILHMAAVVKMWTPDRSVFDAVNVGGLRNVLTTAREAGARLVYTSSFIAIGPAGPEPATEERVHPGDRYRNDYERTKAQADRLARDAALAGQDVVMLYPGVVYGPGAMTDGNLVVKMIVDHIKGRLAGIIGPGDRLWSYSFVDDVAAGHVAALERGRQGDRYFLAGPTVDMNAFFATLQTVAGVAPPRRHIPYGIASLLGFSLYAWAELTGQPPLLTHEVVDVFREHWAYSCVKAGTALGYKATPLEEGLRRTLAWLRAEGHV